MPDIHESIHRPALGQDEHHRRSPVVHHLRWVARDFRREMDEMVQLNLEERGALGSVRGLILKRFGDLPDDVTYVARNLGISTRVWRRLRARLIELGLLVVEDGMIRCRRCEEELAESIERLERASAARAQPAEESPKFRPNSGQESIQFNGLGRLQKQEQESPPNPPEGAPEDDLDDDRDAAFQQIWSAWPLPGRRREAEARWQWQAKLDAGIPVDRLRQACLDRAHDRQARVVGLASFLAKLDLAGEPASATAAGQDDRLAMTKLDAGRIACGRPRAWLERAHAVLGADGVLAVARRAMARDLDARASWEMVELACRQAISCPRRSS